MSAAVVPTELISRKRHREEEPIVKDIEQPTSSSVTSCHYALACPWHTANTGADARLASLCDKYDLQSLQTIVSVVLKQPGFVDAVSSQSPVLRSKSKIELLKWLLHVSVGRSSWGLTELASICALYTNPSQSVDPNVVLLYQDMARRTLPGPGAVFQLVGGTWNDTYELSRWLSSFAFTAVPVASSNPRPLRRERLFFIRGYISRTDAFNAQWTATITDTPITSIAEMTGFINYWQADSGSRSAVGYVDLESGFKELSWSLMSPGRRLPISVTTGVTVTRTVGLLTAVCESDGTSIEPVTPGSPVRSSTAGHDLRRPATLAIPLDKPVHLQVEHCDTALRDVRYWLTKYMDTGRWYWHSSGLAHQFGSQYEIDIAALHAENQAARQGFETMLLGLHPHIGQDSSLHCHLASNPLFDTRLLSLLGGFLF